MILCCGPGWLVGRREKGCIIFLGVCGWLVVIVDLITHSDGSAFSCDTM